MPRLSVKGIRFNDTNEVTPHDPQVLIAHGAMIFSKGVEFTTRKTLSTLGKHL